MKAVYDMAGLSKQAHSRHKQEVLKRAVASEQIKEHIQRQRLLHPGCGLRKLFTLMPNPPVGRDEFINIAMGLGLGIKRRKNYRKTTISVYSLFTNLIAGKAFEDINQVWCSDITYLPMGSKHVYLVLVQDIYSRKIIGYNVSDTMLASGNVAALKRAFAIRKGHALDQLIHHSDRGAQYVAGNYLRLLQDKSIQVSMCNSALDNPFVESLNGILKTEYLDYCRFEGLGELKTQMKKIIGHYNSQRPHGSLKMMTPDAFEKQLENLPQSQRTKLVIHNEHT